MDFIVEDDNGSRRQLRKIVANVNRGSFCGGPSLDCLVDGGQVCHKISVLDRFPNDEYWTEGLNVRHHADGCFLDKLGSLTTIHAVNVDVGCNRKVRESINNR